MANTTPVYARIDNDLKEKAENILSQLGITPSNAIQMLYSQIILYNGMPFELRLPSEPTCVGGMTPHEIDAEIQKGIDDLEAGRVFTSAQVKEMNGIDL